jgi:hypothetical protein
VIEISIEKAYAEACQALGESVVRERLLQAALAERMEQDQRDTTDVDDEHARS